MSASAVPPTATAMATAQPPSTWQLVSAPFELPATVTEASESSPLSSAELDSDWPLALMIADNSVRVLERSCRPSTETVSAWGA